MRKEINKRLKGWREKVDEEKEKEVEREKTPLKEIWKRKWWGGNVFLKENSFENIDETHF
jgi:hypothetical protein